MVVRVEVVVQLCDSVVAITRARHGSEVVVECRWKVQDRTRTQRCQQRIGERAFGARSEQRPCVCNPGVGWLGGQAGQPKDVVLLLIADEEKGLVFLDRSADGKA